VEGDGRESVAIVSNSDFKREASVTRRGTATATATDSAVKGMGMGKVGIETDVEMSNMFSSTATRTDNPMHFSSSGDSDDEYSV